MEQVALFRDFWTNTVFWFSSTIFIIPAIKSSVTCTTTHISCQLADCQLLPSSIWLLSGSPVLQLRALAPLLQQYRSNWYLSNRMFFQEPFKQFFIVQSFSFTNSRTNFFVLDDFATTARRSKLVAGSLSNGCQSELAAVGSKCAFTGPF